MTTEQLKRIETLGLLLMKYANHAHIAGGGSTSRYFEEQIINIVEELRIEIR